MHNTEHAASTESPTAPNDRSECRSIEWYAEGQTRTVEVGGVRVTIRFVSRNGRRARIAITAPAGAVFLSGEVK